MRPSEIRELQRIVRDLATLTVGLFMLIYETVGTANPNEWIIGAGLTAIGVIPLYKLDDWRNTRNGGKESHDDERWSHLP